MLDVVAFVLCVLIAAALLAGVTTFTVTAVTFSSNKQSKNVQNNNIQALAATTNTTVELVLAGPLACLSFVANNIFTTALLALSLYFSFYMYGNESQFFQDITPVYHKINNLWMNGFIEPALALLSVMYGAVVPISNTVITILSETLFATVKVLGDTAEDPFDIIRALLVGPKAAGKIAYAINDIFAKNDTHSWLVNTFDTTPAIQIIQEEWIAKVGSLAHVLCSAMAPAVAITVDVLKSEHLRNTLDGFANLPLRSIQIVAKLVAPNFNKLEYLPLLNELKRIALQGGAVVDDVIEATLRLGYFPLQLGGLPDMDIHIPRPSLGGSVGRLAVAVLEAYYIPLKMMTAALEGKSMYDATDISVPVKHAHLAIEQGVAAAHTFTNLVYQGKLGNDTRLECKYYAYNFFESENVMDSVPDACFCKSRAHCGFRGACVNGLCQCDPGFVNVIPPTEHYQHAPFKCVRKCDSDAMCGTYDDQILGRCRQDGRCDCHAQGKGAVYDLDDGLCKINIQGTRFHNDPVQNVSSSWADGRCDGAKEAKLDPPAECAVQSMAQAGLGVVYTGWQLFRELVFNFNDVINNLDQYLQTFDGKWHSRLYPVSCLTRTEQACSCLAHDSRFDTELTDYNPFCSQPTLNENVYNHLDAFAFFAGHKLPFESTKRLHYVFIGGTGTQWGFMADTIGVYVTTMARKAVERLRVATRIIAGVITYTRDVSLLMANMKQENNLLRLPQNCNWGFTTDSECNEQQYRPNMMECTATNELEGCTCNPMLPYQMGYKCSCIAIFPFLKYKQQQWDEAYKSKYFAQFYQQHVPWCNSMLLEFSYFWEMSTSIAVQNVLARFANNNGNPLASELDSQCFDNTKTYKIATTSALTRLFQPNPSGTAFVFTGALASAPLPNIQECEQLSKLKQIRFKTNLPEKTFTCETEGCNALQSSFLSPAVCFSGPEDTRTTATWTKTWQGVSYKCLDGPYELRELAMSNYMLQPSAHPINSQLLCYKLGMRGRPYADPEFRNNHTAFCQKIQFQNGPWVNITQHKQLTQGYKPQFMMHELHPQTCGAFLLNDNLRFQPCRHTCHTAGGTDTCWCNVTVHHDIRCNLGNMYRQMQWASVEKDRQKTTAILSLFALMKEGIQADNARLMCDRYHAEGSQAAIIASLLTLNKDGKLARKIRESVAKVIFAFWESSIVSGQSLNDAARSVYHSVKSKRKTAGDDLVPGSVEQLTSPGTTLFDNFNALGTTSMNSMAMQSILNDAIHNVLSENEHVKICENGPNVCKPCSADEQCQRNFTKTCQLQRATNQPLDPACNDRHTKWDTYCFPQGQCPQDPPNCDVSCELFGTCPQNHACTPRQYASTGVVTRCSDLAPTTDTTKAAVVCTCDNGNTLNPTSSDYCHACNDVGKRYTYFFAKRCYGWSGFEPNVLCEDKQNCTPPKCVSIESNTVKQKCRRNVPGFASILITLLAKEIMFSAVNFCTLIDAIKHVLVELVGEDEAGAEIITDLQEFINLLFRVLDEALTHLAFLAAKATMAFFGAVTHLSDGELWRKFLVNTWELIITMTKLVTAKAWDLIQVIFGFLPQPFRGTLQSITGAICIATHKTLELLTDFAVSFGFGNPFDHDWSNPDPEEVCLSDPMAEQNDPKRREEQFKLLDLDRRRLKEVWTNHSNYQLLREKVDWTGDTTCARIGRIQVPPETHIDREIWKGCFINRQRVSVIRLALDTQLLPWTFFDDWMQPVQFVLTFWHGVIIYVTEGEAAMHKYAKIGYPTQASIQAVQWAKGWKPNKPLLATAMDITETYWPDTHSNVHSYGHHIFHVLRHIRNAEIPQKQAKEHSWSKLHMSTNQAFKQITHTLQLPHLLMQNKKSNQWKIPPRRRLAQQNVNNYCDDNADDSCINCAILQNIIYAVKQSTSRMAAYYNHDFPRVLDTFVKQVKHWEGQDHGEDNFYFLPNVSIGYTPKPILPTQPTPKLMLQKPTAITNIQWKHMATLFFTITNDTHVPILQHSLWWYLKYPFKPCNTIEMAYDSCNAPKYSIDDAAALTVRVMAIFWTIGFITGLHIPAILQIPMISFLYGIFRYDYVPRCIPILPLCLIEDLQWALQAITPPCFCQLVPELVVNQQECRPGFCKNSLNIAYQNCPDRQLGILWTPLFTLRWLAPSVFEFITAELESVESIVHMREELENGIPLDPIDLACAKVSMFNIITTAILAKIAIVILAAIAVPLIKTVLSAIATIAINIPFLFNDVPAMVKQQIQGEGILIQGW